MKKKMIGFAMAATMATMAFAPTSMASAEESYDVAVLIGDMTATYASWLAYSFEQLEDEYPQLNLSIIDCGNDQATQISNLENCVSKGYDYVIVQPIDVTATADAVNSVIAAGIPCCTVNGSNDGMEEASSVDCDPVQQGAVPAEQALEQIPENANVVVLLGPSGNFHSNGRREGWEETFFSQREDVTILDEQIANWSKEEAMTLMEDWITKYGDDIDAIVSMNDAQALGCLEAWKAAGYSCDDILAYGVDGLADACLSIKDGELTCTSVQNAYDQASNALRIAAGTLAGEIENEVYQSPGELIDSSNVDEWIQIHTDNGQIQ
ncbi:MAG: sugar ABC transporter substrate-binding protein [Lachnospiraceae bacterium]|nr:sugar ABC transporter substrate-binding protein [Lachnospiraceae bacterium]